ncbi:LysR family transcriptional regulator [Aestuariicella hydrocarbonica]|uniref:LysR family transcriptional regulator n=1 Tax=Pseudomaricurvus hydrocarbonicus TaxID=1470433 RepID=A0A9E5T3X6_9GAMM|nr:LysR family transcriptional regulator [Aestuariicella hydrocarbonica]NHO67502.1 LysR family transcriptional regulator [Aestuariicella hydrocarbonica]
MPYTLSQLLNRLSFRQLQVFMAVFERRGYSRAAEELGLTQPAVSAQIRQLEQIFNQPLFDYVGKTLHTTPAGDELARSIQHIFGELQQLQGQLSELEGVISGSLKLAAVSTAQYVVPHLLAGFLKQYPKVEVTMKVVNRAQAISRLAENADDLVIMGMVPEDKSLSFMPFLDNELIPVVHATHPLAQQAHVTIEEFFQQPLLLREHGSGTRHALEAYCSEQRLGLNWVMELGSNAAVKHGVLADLGVAVMPRFSVQLELQQGILQELNIDGFPLRRSWCTVHPSRKHLTPAAEAFLDYIRNNMAQIQTHFVNFYGTKGNPAHITAL